LFISPTDLEHSNVEPPKNNLQHQYYCLLRCDFVTPVEARRLFGGMYCLYLQGLSVFFSHGMRRSPLGPADTGLLYQPQMIDDDCRAISGMRIGKGNRSIRRKHAPVPLCPPQIPPGLEPGPPQWEAGAVTRPGSKSKSSKYPVRSRWQEQRTEASVNFDQTTRSHILDVSTSRTSNSTASELFVFQCLTLICRLRCTSLGMSLRVNTRGG
jgi:hypothetical protein